jgi:hypothetical protein
MAVTNDCGGRPAAPHYDPTDHHGKSKERVKSGISITADKALDPAHKERAREVVSERNQRRRRSRTASEHCAGASCPRGRRHAGRALHAVQRHCRASQRSDRRVSPVSPPVDKVNRPHKAPGAGTVGVLARLLMLDGGLALASATIFPRKEHLLRLPVCHDAGKSP